MSKVRFELGRCMATVRSLQTLQPDRAASLFLRHQHGDWGNVSAEDAKANDDALVHGDRIVSAYVVGDLKYYVITEWDRSLTTLMCAEEY